MIFNIYVDLYINLFDPYSNPMGCNYCYPHLRGEIEIEV